MVYCNIGTFVFEAKKADPEACFYNLNLTTTTNPHFGATINLLGSWPTCHLRITYSLKLEVKGAAIWLAYDKPR